MGHGYEGATVTYMAMCPYCKKLTGWSGGPDGVFMEHFTASGSTCEMTGQLVTPPVSKPFPTLSDMHYCECCKRLVPQTAGIFMRHNDPAGKVCLMTGQPTRPPKTARERHLDLLNNPGCDDDDSSIYRDGEGDD